jgi:hypothetical protein
MSSQVKRSQKSDRVNPINHETIPYEEFVKYRQRYLVTYCPFETFGPKEKKKSVHQKISKWFDNNTMKLKKHKKKHEGKDTKANHNSTNESISNMKECF